MQYLLTPFAKKIEPWAWWDNAFTEKELNWLQLQAKNSSEQGFVGGVNPNELHSDIRRSQVSWLKNTLETQWLFEKLASVVGQINVEHFRFDITGFGEQLQLTNYDQSEHGMYGWHQDYNSGVSRKLSMVVQLTDPSQYEGGNLEIRTNATVQTTPKKRGMIAVFPSYILHQVTPVTQGSRQSLVAWVSGPAFK